MKKFLCFLFAFILLVPVFAACDDDDDKKYFGDFIPETNTEELQTTLAQMNADLDEAESYVTHIPHSYILVGKTENIVDLSEVKIGSTIFKKDDSVTAENIGSSRSYRAYIWDSGSGELRISSLLLYMEGTTIEVKDKTYNLLDRSFSVATITSVDLPSNVKNNDSLSVEDSTITISAKSGETGYDVIAHAGNSMRYIVKEMNTKLKIIQYSIVERKNGGCPIRVKFNKKNNQYFESDSKRIFLIAGVSGFYSLSTIAVDVR